MAAEVTDVPDKRRYEVRADDQVAGYAEYILTEGLITFTHTEIDPSFEGKGMGSVLVRGALDDVRTRELAVLPLCPFVKGWIQRHRDYADLVHQ